MAANIALSGLIIFQSQAYPGLRFASPWAAGTSWLRHWDRLLPYARIVSSPTARCGKHRLRCCPAGRFSEGVGLEAPTHA
jgi:hypothetical protein